MLAEERLDRLFTILEKELLVYGELLSSAEEKKDALINDDVDLVDAITQRDKALIEFVREYEKDRISSLENLTQICPLKIEDITLRELLGAFPPQFSQRKEELSKLRNRMFSALEKLRRLNEVNNALLENRLSYIDFSLRLFSDLTAGDLTYNSRTDGRSTEVIEPKIFDFKG